jgi:predicted nucleotidyltransferase
MVHAEVIAEIKEIVKKTDDSATVILYGSRAKGTARPDSDWDVLILVNKPVVSIKDEQLFRHQLYDLELKTAESFSTFVYSQQEWKNRLSQTPFFRRIQQEGKIL